MAAPGYFSTWLETVTPATLHQRAEELRRQRCNDGAKWGVLERMYQGLEREALILDAPIEAPKAKR